MASPSTEIRAIVKATLEAEFAADALVVLDDRLHPSLGSEGPIAGVHPLDEVEIDTNASSMQTRVRVQVYNFWDKQVDNNQTVDPATIESWAHRFRTALRGAGTPGTGDVWFLRLLDISYPPDPTGNITRFEATVAGWGGNSGLVETG